MTRVRAQLLHEQPALIRSWTGCFPRNSFGCFSHCWLFKMLCRCEFSPGSSAASAECHRTLQLHLLHRTCRSGISPCCKLDTCLLATWSPGARHNNNQACCVREQTVSVVAETTTTYASRSSACVPPHHEQAGSAAYEPWAGLWRRRVPDD